MVKSRHYRRATWTAGDDRKCITYYPQKTITVLFILRKDQRRSADQNTMLMKIEESLIPGPAVQPFVGN